MSQFDEGISTALDVFRIMFKREPTPDDEGWVKDRLTNNKTFAGFLQELAATPEYVQMTMVRTRWPIGHFYSPVVNPATLGDYTERQYALDVEGFAGISINLDRMKVMFQDHSTWLSTLPLSSKKASGRYFEQGGPFPLGDAYTLALMLNVCRPRRIIEVGSGFSTACMLDLADYLDLSVEITCIEPYPGRLKSLLLPRDRATISLREEPVQDVPKSVFSELQAGDILFIDSTHVLKTGSDVHFELFNILPIIKPGVIVHIHDCPYPFEYPEKWITHWNHSWNEVYAIRAFLTNNSHCEVFFWPSMLKQQATSFVRASSFPDYLRVAACSIWLKAI